MKTLTTRKKLLSLLIGQALVAPAQSAVFNINCGDVAQLINAINTANSNGEADEINLNVDNQINCVYPLTAADNTTDGANGLPSITSPITINGNQSAIRRQDGSELFRIVYVASTGNLTLRQLSVENGSNNSRKPGEGWWYGGGIFNVGKLTVEKSKIFRNTAISFGGGIYNRGELTLKRSIISGNTTGWKGGGIYNRTDACSFYTITIFITTARFQIILLLMVVAFTTSAPLLGSLTARSR